MKSYKQVARPTAKKEVSHNSLFDTEPDWKKHWWGMPSFVMDDANPTYRITVNFVTRKDADEFFEKLGVEVSPKAISMWYPLQERMGPGEYEFQGPKTDSKYPVCIPSKGRADCQKTGKALDVLGVSYNFFVEETEYEWYCKEVGENNVVKMPFHDLGQGSIPARNFIWEWAKENNHSRHWVVDDNIMGFFRVTNNRRVLCRTGTMFRAMEDFVDRYENIVMAGPHGRQFMPDRQIKTPYLLNSRIYSCILLDTDLEHRWRGRYNEDTDLSLRLLKDGYCTLLFRSFLMSKVNTMTMKGGNTDNVYNDGTKRLAFAESLKEQHPEIVEIVWKYDRWHHQVDYSQFKNNKPILKANITPTGTYNEYEMELIHVKKS